MNLWPTVSGHWTEEQLIASLYDAGPDNDHLNRCIECRERLSALQNNRQMLENDVRESEDVSLAFLAAQRRKIYSRLSKPSPFTSLISVRRWASAAATLLVLGSGLMYFEHRQDMRKETISDVQLAQEMSRMSQNLEAQPTAPLQGLFE